MGRIGVDDLEDLRTLRLDDEGRDELLSTQTECTFVFAGPDGWPVGVIMSFLYADDSFWLTATRTRAHARAIVDNPRVTLVVSSAGTSLEGRRMLAIRGVAEVRDDRETKDWFLPRFAAQLKTAKPEEFTRLLDSDNRVVFKVRPVGIAASHDSRKMPGDGRGGAGG
jgi:nitroimidazol reductase NimA-like FMN-containing flavoprotein (pyridoxamine 5'-phosphate oxidase superfamily)